MRAASPSSLIIQRFAAKPGWAKSGRIVTPGIILTLIPWLVGILAAEPVAMQQTVTRLVVQDEIVLRVPVQPRPVGPTIDWVEHKAPKCIPANLIRAAVLSGSEQVDFIIAGGARVRAELDENCPALDFYGGFYLQTEDERLCAGRDAVHSRIGGSCTISKFKQLVPKFKG